MPQGEAMLVEGPWAPALGWADRLRRSIAPYIGDASDRDQRPAGPDDPQPGQPQCRGAHVV